jgi:hypothetical protein
MDLVRVGPRLILSTRIGNEQILPGVQDGFFNRSDMGTVRGILQYEQQWGWIRKKGGVRSVEGRAEKLATRFNSLFPGAHRRITVDDVREMAKCGLIGRHGYYEQSDLHTINGILRYELLRGQRLARSDYDPVAKPVSLRRKELR